MSSRSAHKAGDQVVYDGEVFVAVTTWVDGYRNLECNNCEFRKIGAADDGGITSRCKDTDCFGIVWMTPLNAITHRLTK